MRGDQYLTKNTQFVTVYEKGRSWASNMVAVRVAPNGLDRTRYGFSVSRRVGKAVVRNRVKRLLREILRQTPLKPGWDVVFIARAPSAQASFLVLMNTIRGLLTRAGLLAGKCEGVCSRAN